MLPLPKGFNPFYRDVPMENYIFRATNGGSKIATARDTLAALRMNPNLTLKDWFRLSCQQILLTIQDGLWDKPVQGRILYGRWMVDCPECKGANDVDPGEPVYICTSCGWPGWFAPVLFPVERKLIENLLLQRKRISARNWMPGETADQIMLENLAHGE